MQSDFKPEHIQRAKETLHRQLEVVKQEISMKKEREAEEKKAATSFWERISSFLKDLF